jgi:hypothetical protein
MVQMAAVGTCKWLSNSRDKWSKVLNQDWDAWAYAKIHQCHACRAWSRPLNRAKTDVNVVRRLDRERSEGWLRTFHVSSRETQLIPAGQHAAAIVEIVINTCIHFVNSDDQITALCLRAVRIIPFTITCSMETIFSAAELQSFEQWNELPVGQ